MQLSRLFTAVAPNLEERRLALSRDLSRNKVHSVMCAVAGMLSTLRFPKLNAITFEGASIRSYKPLWTAKYASKDNFLRDNIVKFKVLIFRKDLISDGVITSFRKWFSLYSPKALVVFITC